MVTTVIDDDEVVVVVVVSILLPAAAAAIFSAVRGLVADEGEILVDDPTTTSGTLSLALSLSTESFLLLPSLLLFPAKKSYSSLLPLLLLLLLPLLLLPVLWLFPFFP